MKEEFKRGVSVGVGLTMAVSGASSVAAETFNIDFSVAGGNKSMTITDDNPDRHTNALNKLGVDTSSLFASAEVKESVKTSTRKVIVQIGEKFCLVSDPDVSGEKNVLKENDTCPEIINNRTMVPLRFISEALGATVDWNGEDQSIALKKSNKEIGMQIGNNLMKVNDSGVVKESVLDSPPVVNKDNRTLVPVRAIAEAFGIEVQWDGDTNSVFIGYSKTEMNNLLSNSNIETEISADAIDLDSSYQASRFMAGGKYIDGAEEGPFATKDKQSGAVVVFSDDDFLKIDKTISLIEKSKCNADELHQQYLDKSIISKIKDKLNSNDCVYVLNGEAYVFNDENLQQGNKTLTKYDAFGNPTTITNDKAGVFYYSRLAFDKNLGICVFDGNKITYKLNTQTQQFDELPTPEFIGTLEQRTIYNLETAYNTKILSYVNGQGVETQNCLGLDYQDILEYKNTGSDANCKSFKLIKVNDNLGFICMTGGQCGLQNENLKTVEFLVESCNKIDPDIFQKCIYNGLTFLATNKLPGPLFIGETKDWYSTYMATKCGGIVFINEATMVKNVRCAIFSDIVGESEGLGFRNHLIEKNGVFYININGVIYTTGEESWKKGQFKEIYDRYFLNWDWFNWKKK